MFCAITSCGSVLGIGKYPDCARSDVSPAQRPYIALIARASADVEAYWASEPDELNVVIVNGVAEVSGEASNQRRVV